MVVTSALPASHLYEFSTHYTIVNFDFDLQDLLSLFHFFNTITKTAKRVSFITTAREREREIGMMANRRQRQLIFLEEWSVDVLKQHLLRLRTDDDGTPYVTHVTIARRVLCRQR